MPEVKKITVRQLVMSHTKIITYCVYDKDLKPASNHNYMDWLVDDWEIGHIKKLNGEMECWLEIVASPKEEE